MRAPACHSNSTVSTDPRYLGSTLGVPSKAPLPAPTSQRLTRRWAPKGLAASVQEHGNLKNTEPVRGCILQTQDLHPLWTHVPKRAEI